MYTGARDRRAGILQVISVALSGGMFLCEEYRESDCRVPEKKRLDCSRLSLLTRVASCSGHPACCAGAAVLTQVLLRRFLLASNRTTGYTGSQGWRRKARPRPERGANKSEGWHEGEATDANAVKAEGHSVGDEYREDDGDVVYKARNTQEEARIDLQREHEQNAAKACRRPADAPASFAAVEKRFATASDSVPDLANTPTHRASRSPATPCLFTLLRTAAQTENRKTASVFLTGTRRGRRESVPWRALQEAGDDADDDSSEGTTTTEARSERDRGAEAAAEDKARPNTGDARHAEGTQLETLVWSPGQLPRARGGTNADEVLYSQECRRRNRKEGETENAEPREENPNAGMQERSTKRPPLSSGKTLSRSSSVKLALASGRPPECPASAASLQSRRSKFLLSCSLECSSEASPFSSGSNPASAAPGFSASASPSPAARCSPGALDSPAPATQSVFERAEPSFTQAAQAAQAAQELRNLINRSRCPFMPSVILAAAHVALFTDSRQGTAFRAPRRRRPSRRRAAGHGDDEGDRKRTDDNRLKREDTAEREEEGESRGETTDTEGNRAGEKQLDDREKQGSDGEKQDSDGEKEGDDGETGAWGLTVVLDALLQSRKFWWPTTDDVDILRRWAASPNVRVPRSDGEKQLFLVCLRDRAERLAFFRDILGIPNSLGRSSSPAALPSSTSTPFPLPAAAASASQLGSGVYGAHPACLGTLPLSSRCSAAVLCSHAASSSAAPACSSLSRASVAPALGASPPFPCLSFSFTSREGNRFPLLPFVVAFFLPMRRAERRGHPGHDCLAKGQPTAAPAYDRSSPRSSLTLARYLVACVAESLRRAPGRDWRAASPRTTDQEERREWGHVTGVGDGKGTRKAPPASSCDPHVAHPRRMTADESPTGLAGVEGVPLDTRTTRAGTRKSKMEKEEERGERPQDTRARGAGGTDGAASALPCVRLKRTRFSFWFPPCVASTGQSTRAEEDVRGVASRACLSAAPKARSIFFLFGASAFAPGFPAGCPASSASVQRLSSASAACNPLFAARSVVERSATPGRYRKEADTEESKKRRAIACFEEDYSCGEEAHVVLFRLFLRLLPRAEEDEGRSPLWHPMASRPQTSPPHQQSRNTCPPSRITSAVPRLPWESRPTCPVPCALLSASPSSPSVPLSASACRSSPATGSASVAAGDSFPGAVRPLQSLGACAAWLERRHDDARAAALAGLLWLCWAEERRRDGARGDSVEGRRRDRRYAALSDVGDSDERQRRSDEAPRRSSEDWRETAASPRTESWGEETLNEDVGARPAHALCGAHTRRSALQATLSDEETGRRPSASPLALADSGLRWPASHSPPPHTASPSSCRSLSSSPSASLFAFSLGAASSTSAAPLAESWNVRRGGRTCLWASAVSLHLLAGNRQLEPFAFVAFVLPEAFLVTAAQRRVQSAAQSLGETERTCTRTLEGAKARADETRIFRKAGSPTQSFSAWRRDSAPGGRIAPGVHAPDRCPRSLCVCGARRELAAHGRLGRKRTLRRQFEGRCGEAVASRCWWDQDGGPRSEWTDANGSKEPRRGRKEAHGEADGREGNTAGVRAGGHRRAHALGQGVLFVEREDLDALRFCWLHLLRESSAQWENGGSDAASPLGSAWPPGAEGSRAAPSARSERQDAPRGGDEHPRTTRRERTETGLFEASETEATADEADRKSEDGAGDRDWDPELGNRDGTAERDRGREGGWKGESARKRSAFWRECVSSSVAQHVTATLSHFADVFDLTPNCLVLCLASPSVGFSFPLFSAVPAPVSTLGSRPRPASPAVRLCPCCFVRRQRLQPSSTLAYMPAYPMRASPFLCPCAATVLSIASSSSCAGARETAPQPQHRSPSWCASEPRGFASPPPKAK
uniref:Uncharacterized protein n=1 Tax=Neospora caninum (strain Liverpool) TaxID=572307 RepID=A0A0F7UIL5_NEOCL|nr:TPA: hypothetical protein BN1204_037300 [Neospora caninum Liverpool]